MQNNNSNHQSTVHQPSFCFLTLSPCSNDLQSNLCQSMIICARRTTKQKRHMSNFCCCHELKKLILHGVNVFHATHILVSLCMHCLCIFFDSSQLLHGSMGSTSTSSIHQNDAVDQHFEHEAATMVYAG